MIHEHDETRAVSESPVKLADERGINYTAIGAVLLAIWWAVEIAAHALSR